MPRRKWKPLQANALFILDIVREEENKGLFPDIDIGDISDEDGDFSKRTDGQYPIFDPPDSPVIRWNPRRSWGFPREGLPQGFPLN
jgi:hypothetical protein